MIDINIIKKYAEKAYNGGGSLYDGKSYMIHINSVVDLINKYSYVFKNDGDKLNTMCAGYLHDAIEDTIETYSSIKRIAGVDVADIVLGVTDVDAENRLMKHLLTMGKTVKDYRALILKLCDMLANATYSKENNSSKYYMYVYEYNYRKPIFFTALGWYKKNLNWLGVLDLFNELDEIHYG